MVERNTHAIIGIRIIFEDSVVAPTCDSKETLSCRWELFIVKKAIFLTNQMNLCRTFNECLFFNKEHDGEGKVYRLLEN